jgi:hypothetical protein
MMGLLRHPGTGYPSPTRDNRLVVLLPFRSLSSTFYLGLCSYFGYRASARGTCLGVRISYGDVWFEFHHSHGGRVLAKENCQYCLFTAAVDDIGSLCIYFVSTRSHQAAIENMDSNKSTISRDLITTFLGILESLKLVVMGFLLKGRMLRFCTWQVSWALISTLSVYAVMVPFSLGTIRTHVALGLCTHDCEAVLVRIVVPMLGEKSSP